MYIKLDPKLYKKISDITSTDYEAIGDFVPGDSIEPMLEDLLLEIDALNEKYNDFENEVEEYYERKPYDPYDEYGVSRNDFI